MSLASQTLAEVRIEREEADRIATESMHDVEGELAVYNYGSGNFFHRTDVQDALNIANMRGSALLTRADAHAVITFHEGRYEVVIYDV